jgi:hypothetical protein
MRTKIVNVTQNDINAARESQGCDNYDAVYHCPIARAVSRLAEGKRGTGTWGVTTGAIGILYDMKTKTVDDRYTASRFVTAFDDGLYVEPTSFKVVIKEFTL